MARFYYIQTLSKVRGKDLHLHLCSLNQFLLFTSWMAISHWDSLVFSSDTGSQKELKHQLIADFPCSLCLRLGITRSSYDCSFQIHHFLDFVKQIYKDLPKVVVSTGCTSGGFAETKELCGFHLITHPRAAARLCAPTRPGTLRTHRWSQRTRFPRRKWWEWSRRCWLRLHPRGKTARPEQ